MWNGFAVGLVKTNWDEGILSVKVYHPANLVFENEWVLCCLEALESTYRGENNFFSAYQLGSKLGGILNIVNV